MRIAYYRCKIDGYEGNVKIYSPRITPSDNLKCSFCFGQMDLVHIQETTDEKLYPSPISNSQKF